MRRLMLGAGMVMVTTGCALTTPATPTVTPTGPTSSVSATRRFTLGSDQSPSPDESSSSEETPEESTTSTAASSASSGLGSTVTPTRLATVKLPASVGDYRAQQQTGQTGQQSVTYAVTEAPADLVIVTVIPGAGSPTLGPAYTNAKVYGPALCGSIDAEGTVGASCVLPLDHGVILISGSGFQKVDQMAQFAGRLWEQVP